MIPNNKDRLTRKLYEKRIDIRTFEEMVKLFDHGDIIPGKTFIWASSNPKLRGTFDGFNMENSGFYIIDEETGSRDFYPWNYFYKTYFSATVHF